MSIDFSIFSVVPSEMVTDTVSVVSSVLTTEGKSSNSVHLHSCPFG